MKQHAKKSFSVFSFIFLFSIFYFLFSRVASAQSPSTQKALETVKEGVNTLVETKDASALDSTNLKIETFKKVVDLAFAEIKDLKTKLLGADIEASSSLALWQEKTTQNLNTIIAYYTKQKDEIETTEETLDADSIKLMAENFKQWREKEYISQETQIRDLLLIQQENKAIETAEKRLEKIGSDLLRLQKTKIKNFSSIQKLFEKAADAVKTARVLNSDAEKTFFERYVFPLTIPKLEKETKEEKSLETEENATTTETIIGVTTPAVTTFATTTTVTTSSVISETPSSTTPTIIQPSIRDLVRDSFIKVRETYQIFIEMSNVVRKLLK